MSKCSRCVAPKELCKDCRDNPIYANVPVESKFMLYIPQCPRGHKDCVNDPAYIKFFHPRIYEEIYGNKTLFEAAEECREWFMRSPNDDFFCYDTEDK